MEEDGALFRTDKNINSSEGIIQIGTDFLQQINEWSNNQFSISLRKNLGLKNFTKLIVLHEAGHYIDYLLHNQLLLIPNKDLILQRSQNLDFINETIFQDFINSWKDSRNLFANAKYENIDNYLKRNLQENIADCWSCLLLYLMEKEKPNNLNKNLMFEKITSYLIQARATIHLNAPDNKYSTYNALQRLIINYKIKPINTNLEFINLIQKSAQEGLVQNLKEIFTSSDKKMILLKENIKETIESNSGEGKIEEKIINTANKFKRVNL